MSDSWRPRGQQHARLPCPSPHPGACSSSRPLSQRCHSAISPSVIPSSSCPQSFPASGSFLMSRLFASGGRSISPSTWDLNPCGWGSNPAKIHGTWFQGLVKLRFLTSHHRKNSVRDKVTGKKWIYSDSEQNRVWATDRVWAIAEGKCGPETWRGWRL